jgi:hypothetical protein
MLLTAAAACGAMAQSLSQVTVSPTSVEGGKRAMLSIVLDEPAPRGGVTVDLSSSDTSVATVPASVTISHRRFEVEVPVTTTAVDSSTSVTLTATLGESSMDATLAVGPLELSGLAVSPSTIVGGDTATGMVVLDGQAPSGGWVITLSSDNSAATVPASVTVEQGRSQARFSITTTAVTESQDVTITATDPNGVAQTATLTVNPLMISAFQVMPDSVTGGKNAQGFVAINERAPSGGVVITLASSDASTTVPTSVTIAEGSTHARFQITPTAVTTATPVTLTATDPSGNALTADLTVEPVKLAWLAIQPDRVKGGGSTQAMVFLDGSAPTGGYVITLSSNDSAATVPASVTIAAGDKTASFTITSSAVTKRTTVTITATDPNGVAVTATLQIR